MISHSRRFVKAGECDRDTRVKSTSRRRSDHHPEPEVRSLIGVQDMAGNVWEGTASLIKKYPYSLSDGRGDADSSGNRVIRGGSWDSGGNWGRSVPPGSR